MDPGTAPSAAQIKLAWWQEELRRLAAGSPLHPISRFLASLPRAEGADFAPLERSVEAAARHIAGVAAAMRRATRSAQRRAAGRPAACWPRALRATDPNRSGRICAAASRRWQPPSTWRARSRIIDARPAADGRYSRLMNCGGRNRGRGSCRSRAIPSRTILCGGNAAARRAILCERRGSIATRAGGTPTAFVGAGQARSKESARPRIYAGNEFSAARSVLRVDRRAARRAAKLTALRSQPGCRYPSITPPRPACSRGRVILITGASGGLGRALALECARAGASVILSGRNGAKLDGIYDEIEALGAPQPAIAKLDLATATAVDYDHLAKTIGREFGSSTAWCTPRPCWAIAHRWSNTTSPPGAACCT